MEKKMEMVMKISKVGYLKGSQHRRQDLVSCDSDSVMGGGVGAEHVTVFFFLSPLLSGLINHESIRLVNVI